MHIAVCDDNIAERKQTERLLGRQSDKHKKAGEEGFFIDSYGNIPAFLSVPQMYDALFVDMQETEETGLDVAYMLLKAGVVAPIILLNNDKYNYKEMAGSDADKFYYLNKPIRVKELEDILDICIEYSRNRIPTIELRNDAETIYAVGDDIISVVQEGSYLEYTLTNNRSIKTLDNLYNFCDGLETFPMLCPISDNVVVNVNHISKVGLLTVNLDNGKRYHLGMGYKNNIAEARKYLEEQ
ncbi:MAG: hypothetical protein K6A23_09035 [Butyrivibrio sp.]|nr:hypothetical protein [Butyrivibrio sp.]